MYSPVANIRESLVNYRISYIFPLNSIYKHPQFTEILEIAIPSNYLNHPNLIEKMKDKSIQPYKFNVYNAN